MRTARRRDWAILLFRRPRELDFVIYVHGVRDCRLVYSVVCDSAHNSHMFIHILVYTYS